MVWEPSNWYEISLNEGLKYLDHWVHIVYTQTFPIIIFSKTLFQNSIWMGYINSMANYWYFQKETCAALAGKGKVGLTGVKITTVQTLTSSLKTACWIILRLFRPEAISSRSMAALRIQQTSIWTLCFILEAQYTNDLFQASHSPLGLPYLRGPNTAGK